MITNVSSRNLSFKRMYPEDFAEITGKTPDYSFYPKDNNGRIITDYFDDCIEKHNLSQKTANLKGHSDTPNIVRYSDLNTIKNLNKLVAEQKAEVASKQTSAKLSIIKRIKNLLKKIL